jgi:hypothetical protein
MLTEEDIREMGRQVGKCYAPDPESGEPPYRCDLPSGHEGQCASFIYSWIEHDGIGHPGSPVGERRWRQEQ